jgi:predicted metal-binding protein
MISGTLEECGEMREVKPTWQGAVFVCTHEREPESGKAWCGRERGTDLREWLKARRKAEGLKGRILVAKSSCLGVCSKHGVTVAIMPSGSEPSKRQMVVFGPGDDRERLWARIRNALVGE